MRDAGRILAAFVLLLGGPSEAADGQGFTLDCGPLLMGDGYEVHMSGGGPHGYYFLFVDEDPGPTQVAGVGTLALGFSPELSLMPVALLDAAGSATVTGALADDPARTGDMVHAQAMCHDATAPSGYLISNPLSRGFHPARGVPVTTTPLELGENGVVLLPFPGGLTFPFYGTGYTQIGASANGLVTPGGTTLDSTESILDLYLGLPKVAVLWDDLSVSPQGGVRAETGAGFLRLVWDRVPQFLIGDQNTAEVTLHASGLISLAWERVDLPDGLVGIGPGGAQGSVVNEDWSSVAEGLGGGLDPLVEQFFPGFNPNDLEGARITFEPLPGGGYRWFR